MYISSAQTEPFRAGMAMGAGVAVGLLVAGALLVVVALLLGRAGKVD